MDVIQAAVFDYAALDTETRIVIQQRTTEIKGLMKRAASDIIEIGQKLIEVKAKLGHGNFYNWLRAEFDWTSMTANRFMNVAEQFKSNKLLDLNFATSALYLLAAPSTPESARQEAVERAAGGEVITHQAARSIVSSHRNPPPPLASDAVEAVEHLDTLAPALSVNDSEALPFEPVVAADVWWDGDADGDLLIPYEEQVAARITSPAPRTHPNQQPADPESDEWYTPAYLLDVARTVMGEIDLDPATSEASQRHIGALAYYTSADDGLVQDWRGRVWLNPPYSDPLPWIVRLLAAYECGAVTEALVLVNTANSPEWARLLWRSPYRVCLLAKRVPFHHVTRGETRGGAQDQMLWYLGPNAQQFVAACEGLGALR